MYNPSDTLSSWPDVLDEWRFEEKDVWAEHYAKLGFKSWYDWRWSMIKTLKLDERDWRIQELENPVEAVRLMHCNRLTRWREFCTSEFDSTFRRVSNHPFFTDHARVRDMRTGMPRATQLIGLTSHGDTMLVDGHHRAVAMVGMNPAQASSLNVSLAHAEVDPAFFEKLLRGDTTLLFERKLLDVVSLVRAKLTRA